jgi:hypothetical protein
MEISIPKFKNLLDQLIIRPVILGDPIETKYIAIGPHDSSNKLQAFLKAFDYDFATIEEFFSDKFWVQLFEELITNERVVGDTIQFDTIKSKTIVALSEKGIELGNKKDTYCNVENLEIGLKRTVGELCNYRIFLKGFNLKCRKCSSEFWYSLQEVREKINCKGCLEDFEFPIEPKFAYKLNDLIKNNIYQTKKSRCGNLTVIRTLADICFSSNLSFDYSSQINLYDDPHSNKPCAELDIICQSDGLLIIGESKHNSSAFFDDKSKSLKSLLEIAIAIRPDKIILSCYEDTNDKLEKAKKSLIHLFNKWEYIPEIETILLQQPDDFNLGEFRYFYY